jgi:hypothetical protein
MYVVSRIGEMLSKKIFRQYFDFLKLSIRRAFSSRQEAPSETRQFHEKKNAGFGLLDTALALAVTGFLMVAVLKGQELIESARLRGLLSQVDQFRTAVQLFTERYDAIPGDFSAAKTVIDSSLDNGSQNGTFESLNDAKRFWAHLTKSGIIHVNMNDGFPTSKIGGVFKVSSQVDEHPGIWLVLASTAEGNGGAATPAQAASIDTKGDDGNPATGSIQSIKGNGDTGECVTEGQYNITNTKKACVLLFKIF